MPRTVSWQLNDPAQLVLQAGLAGNQLNYFRAPTRWTAFLFNQPSAVYFYVVNPVAGKTIRLYRYVVQTEMAVATTILTVFWDGAAATNIFSHSFQANSPAQPMEFGPVGITGPTMGLGFGGFVTGAANVQTRIFVQYSFEDVAGVNDD